MELVQTVLVQIAAARLDAASRPDGLVAELEAHRVDLAHQPGFREMRVTRSINPGGDTLLSVETRWKDNNSLADYTARMLNVESIVRKHQDVTVRGSLQVLRMEALAGEPAAPSAPVYERLAFALFVPLGVFAFGLLVIYGLSRIYLAIPKNAATPLAAAVAIGILAVSGFLATHPVLQRWQIAAIVGGAVALLAGGAIYAGIHGKEKTEAVRSPTPTAAAAVPSPQDGLTVVGKDIKFNQNALRAPEGTVTIEFDNQDTGILHNIHVFKGTSASGDSVGFTKLTAGPVKQTLKLDLTPGTYFYHCDAHPIQMTGTLTITAAAGGGAPSTPAAGASAPSGAAPGLTVVGKDIKFEQTSLTASSGKVAVEFDNQDSGITHNIHFFKGESASGESVGFTKLTAGPVKQTLALDLTAGTYFYHCDAHPQQMQGKLVVK